MAEAGKPPRPFGSGVADLVDRVVNGRKINRKTVEGALDDVASWVFSGQQQQASQQQQSPSGQAGPAPGAQSRRWWDIPRPAPPPPPDPKIEERKRARKVIGFAPNETLTLEMIKDRRKTLARKHHPDRGGSLAKMQAINAAADVLESAVRS
jgi:hypothetical protein